MTDEEKKKRGIIHSSRFKTKLTSETVVQGLSEMFHLLLNKQLKPYVDRMIAEKDFKPLRAFGDWHTGFNKFSLEIFGTILPEDVEIQQDEDMPQDSAHYIENLTFCGEKSIDIILKEILKANLTGNFAPIHVEVTVAMFDCFYAFDIVWKCFPQNFDKAQNAHNN